MRLLLVLAVAISASSQVVGWNLHNSPDNDVIVMADRGFTFRPMKQELTPSRLLFPYRGDIYRTLPELAHLGSDSEDNTVDWQPRVDPTTDTEPWSRTDIGSDPELSTGSLCQTGESIWQPCDLSSDTSLDYDSSSPVSLGQSPPDENDEMKPVLRTSQVKRKQTNRSRHGGRIKRETVGTETDEQEKRGNAFSSWGGKRANGFNPWGGKRNPAFSVVGSVRRRAFTSTGSKRTPIFSSWGGKRSQSFSLVGERRLNSWGGNSNPSLTLSSSEDGPAFTVLGTKRQVPFNSWGGKRDARFSSWGGKRDPAFTILGGHHDQAFREPAFQIIGGGITDPSFTVVSDKREPAFKILGNHDFPAFSILGNTYEPSFSVLSPKRSPGFNPWGGKRDPGFNAWGGKRDHEFSDPPYSTLVGKRDPGFSPWGGKRSNAFSPWGGKRDDETDFPKRGTKFSSWGGKRDSDEEDKRTFSSWGGKRDVPDGPKRTFFSWGGKRGAATQTEDLDNNHENGTGSKEVVENGNLSDEDKDKDDVENQEHGEGEDDEVEKEENEDGMKNASTQTSLEFQQLLNEFDNKMHLEEKEMNEDIHQENGHDDGEHKEEDEEKVDVNMDQEIIGMEDKSVGTSNTEDRGIGTSDMASISKRLDRSEGRVSKAVFSPWGGKRVSPSLFSILGSMHRGFGRSDGILPDFLYKRGTSKNSILGSKKWGQSSSGTVFSSWGGKRSERPTGSILSSWGGNLYDKENNLRKINSPNLGRQYRSGTDLFYSWGGKR